MNKTELIEELAGRFGASGAQAAPLPPDYALNASDPDVLLLLRADGTTAARGATARGILEAAEHDVNLSLNGWLP